MEKFTIIVALLIFLVVGSFLSGVKVGKISDNRTGIAVVMPTPRLVSDDYIPAINRNWFVNLPKFVKNIKMDEKYYLTIESKGVVTAIDLKGKYVGETLFPFGIKYKSGGIDDWWYISPILFNLREIYIEENGITKPGVIEDIKIGDQVMLQEMVNLDIAPFDPRHSKAWIAKIIR